MQSMINSYMMGTTDEYEDFKALTEASEKSTLEAVDFFEERLTMAVNTQKYLDNLAFKASNLNCGNQKLSKDCTLSLGWNQFAIGFQGVLLSHKKVRTAIVDETKNLKETKEMLKNELKLSREQVQRARDAYIRYKNHELPKLQTAYERKCKELDLLEKDKDAIGTPKFLKTQKDMTNADTEYRKGVWELDRLRLLYWDKWERQRTRVKELERIRVDVTQSVLLKYIEAERAFALEQVNIWNDLSNKIRSDVNSEFDSKILADEIVRAWPNHPVRLYRNPYYGEAKDMIFNISLRDYLQHHRATVPKLLEKAIQSIEARALDKEGIYRISGKNSEINDLKVRVERDFDLVNFDEIDVNVLASIVKHYLRQLPDPLFPYPANDRAEFAKRNMDDRIRILQRYVSDMPFNHQTTLKFLVEHFVRIADRADENKMTPQNIALVFAPVIFGSQTDSTEVPLPAVKETSNSGGFFKFGGKGEQNNNNNNNDMKPSIAQYQSWKGDAVIETLMEHRDKIFPSQDFRRGMARPLSQNYQGSHHEPIPPAARHTSQPQTGYPMMSSPPSSTTSFAVIPPSQGIISSSHSPPNSRPVLLPVGGFPPPLLVTPNAPIPGSVVMPPQYAHPSAANFPPRDASLPETDRPAPQNFTQQVREQQEAPLIQAMDSLANQNLGHPAGQPPFQRNPSPSNSISHPPLAQQVHTGFYQPTSPGNTGQSNLTPFIHPNQLVGYSPNQTTLNQHQGMMQPSLTSQPAATQQLNQTSQLQAIQSSHNVTLNQIPSAPNYNTQPGLQVPPPVQQIVTMQQLTPPVQSVTTHSPSTPKRLPRSESLEDQSGNGSASVS